MAYVQTTICPEGGQPLDVHCLQQLPSPRDLDRLINGTDPARDGTAQSPRDLYRLINGAVLLGTEQQLPEPPDLHRLINEQFC